MKKTITKEKWQKYVANNSTDSYSLVCCLLILMLWEENADFKEKYDIEKKLREMPEASGLTGFQAESIIAKVLGNRPDFKIGSEAFLED